MFAFDEFLDEHASELFRLELSFAFLVIAVGCGIALHGACQSGEVRPALLGGANANAPPAENIFALAKLPLNVAELSGRYGDLCNFRLFTKVRET